MCKACRQRSIWARIKLLSSISVWQFSLPSHSSEFPEKHLVFRLSFTLSTWYLKFSRKAEASLGCLQLPDTHAYRFVDQFLKNTLFRADEVENYKILFLRVKAFRKILFFFFFWPAAFWSAGLRIMPKPHSLVKSFSKNLFNPDLAFSLWRSSRRSGVGILRTVSRLSNHPLKWFGEASASPIIQNS